MMRVARRKQPWSCGHLGDPRHECRCPPPLVERYRSRISGPLLDRIDMHVEVPAVSLRELRGQPGERSSAVAERVARAREVARHRFGEGTSTPFNAAMTPEHIRVHCDLEPEAQKPLHRAFDRLKLSARALSRVMQVGRTIADLDGAEVLRSCHVAEAIQYRTPPEAAARGPARHP